jgi:hypothetical protein
MLKRIAVIATAIALCTSAPVGAQVESYPPDTSSLTLNAPACNLGSISGTVFGVLPGSTVTITAQLPAGAGATLPLQEIGSTTATGGSDFTAPFEIAISTARFGTATVAATGSSAVGDPFTLQGQLQLVPCPELPRAGSDALPWIRFGLVLTAAGGALAVAAARRRHARVT